MLTSEESKRCSWYQCRMLEYVLTLTAIAIISLVLAMFTLKVMFFTWLMMAVCKLNMGRPLSLYELFCSPINPGYMTTSDGYCPARP